MEKIIGIMITHGLRLGGIQYTVLEQLDALQDDIDFYVITCNNVNKQYLYELKRKSNVKRIFFIQCSSRTKLELAEYVQINLHDLKHITEKIINSNINKPLFLWIVDELHHHIPDIKKEFQNIPLLAHFHSYAYACPWWARSYGFQIPCTYKCNASRIIKCKQLINKYLSQYGFLDILRARVYSFLDLIKGPIDFLIFNLKVKKDIIENANYLIFPSYYALKLMESQYVEIKKDFNRKSVVIYNPVEIPKDIDSDNHRLRHSQSADKVFQITYPSSFNEMKGYHILLFSLPYVLRKVKEYDVYNDIKIKFSIVGGKLHYRTFSTILQKIMRLADISKGRIEIEIQNPIPRNKLIRLMASSDIVVTPFTIPDPAPRVVVEALKTGTPVVTSRIGGSLEFAREGIDGLHVEPNNPIALAKKILESMLINFDRNKIAKDARTRFNSALFKKEFMQLITKIGM